MERSTDMGRQLRPAATAPFAAGLAVLAALLAGCGGQPPPSVPQNAPQVGPAVVTALPDVPSPQAEMVCQPEAQQDIQDLIGVVPTAVGPDPVRQPHLDVPLRLRRTARSPSSCEDLPNDITTTRTYEALAGKLGRVEKIDLPDAEAYTTNDGSIVLRRDTKVMLVDVTQLPGTFGNPPSPRGDAARLIMKAVLNCWVG